MKNKFTTPRPFPALITLLAVGVMTWLGLWQLERLEWKEGLIQKIEAGRTLEPLPALPANADTLLTLEFRRVVLKGHFKKDAPLFQVVATRGGKSGFNLFVPFTLVDGRVLMVNRGFVAAGKGITPRAANEKEILGLLRTQPKRPAFLPADDVARNLWFTPNISGMAQQAGLTLLPLYADALGTPKAEDYPQPVDGNIVLRNDHLGYAITWFSIALAAVVIFILYHRKPS